MFSWEVDEELELCLVEKSFASIYVELAKQNYDNLSEWLQWPRACSKEEDFKAFIKQSLHDYADGKSLVCAMRYKGTIVGNISFNTIDQNREMVEIGYWLAQPYQGNGIVTRCCKHLIQYAFDKLDISKVQICAADGNSASRAVCERLGMTLEGIITYHERVGDRILDHAVYGLYKDGNRNKKS
ncbi:GNAT family protein [Vibrio hannami]|uniref:GNAT family N-acetyltransferase n=1 Tax=Vibrio hannami TaxID=2717094 RepID=UPI00240F2791|nr:GNAT family protein [Vibrio hannami]MDG3088450.1 GNAT family protein [Vibrio hannami]